MKKDRDIIFAEHMAVGVIHIIFGIIILITIATTIAKYTGF